VWLQEELQEQPADRQEELLAEVLAEGESQKDRRKSWHLPGCATIRLDSGHNREREPLPCRAQSAIS
jgi:hypothetical protein